MDVKEMCKYPFIHNMSKKPSSYSFTTSDNSENYFQDMMTRFDNMCGKFQNFFTILNCILDYDVSVEILHMTYENLQKQNDLILETIREIKMIIDVVNSDVVERVPQTKFAIGEIDESFDEAVKPMAKMIEACNVPQLSKMFLDIKKKFEQRCVEIAEKLYPTTDPNHQVKRANHRNTNSGKALFNRLYNKSVLKVILYEHFKNGIYDGGNGKMTLMLNRLPQKALSENKDCVLNMKVLENLRNIGAGGQALMLENCYPLITSGTADNEQEKLKLKQDIFQFRTEEVFKNMRELNVLKGNLHSILTTIQEMKQREASITALHMHFYQNCLTSNSTLEVITYFTEVDQKFFLIMLDQLIRDTSTRKYLNYIQVFLVVKKFIEKIDFSDRDKLMGAGIKSALCDLKKKFYIAVNRCSEYVKEMMLLVSLIFQYFIKAFLKEKSKGVILFALVNDFKDIDETKVIFDQITCSQAEIDAGSCKSRWLKAHPCCILKNTCPINGEPDTLIEFNYVFNNCQLLEIPKFINVETFLFELEQDLLFITFGYSGVGKSKSLFGGATGDGTVVEGILQGFLKTLPERTQFYFEVLEIYGQALPVNESFNTTDSKTDRIFGNYIKNIMWIRQYNKMLDSDGKYEFLNDPYHPEKDNSAMAGYDVDKDFIRDIDKIKEYFKNRLKDTSKLFHVQDHRTFLANIDGFVVGPVEEKRKIVGSIFPTPNNPDSSRSILIYTLRFKLSTAADKFVTMTIIDFPGKEHPVNTYVTTHMVEIVQGIPVPPPEDPAARIAVLNTDKYKNKIAQGAPAFTDVVLKRFEDLFPDLINIMLLLPFIPFLLFTFSYRLNNKIIEALNTKLPIITKDPDFILKVNQELKGVEICKDKNSKSWTFNDIFEMISNKDANGKKFVDPNGYEKTGVDFNTIKQNFNDYEKNVYLNSLTGGRPNILRLQYLYNIFKILLNKLNAPITIDLFLNTLKTTPTNELAGQLGSAKAGIFEFDSFKNNKNIFCDKMRNIFEAYFINETIILILRDAIKYAKQNTNLDHLRQKVDLSIDSRLKYVLQRLCSGNNAVLGLCPDNDCKTIIKDFQALVQSGDIYEIAPTVFGTDQEKKDLYTKLNNETKNLYDYSLLISKDDQNDLLDLLNIKSDKLRIIVTYVFSNVDIEMKCDGQFNLLKSFEVPFKDLIK